MGRAHSAAFQNIRGIRLLVGRFRCNRLLPGPSVSAGYCASATDGRAIPPTGGPLSGNRASPLSTSPPRANSHAPYEERRVSDEREIQRIWRLTGLGRPAEPLPLAGRWPNRLQGLLLQTGAAGWEYL